MAEATEEQPQLEVVDGTKIGLKSIATVDMSDSSGNDAISPREVASIDTDSSESGNDMDTNGDASEHGILDILDFDDDKTTNFGGNTNETGESSKAVGEVIEEEIVELEFEKVKPKLETHSMHCPHCKSEISKVVLRRKVIKSYQPVDRQTDPVTQPIDPDYLVGCFSCLSLFTCSENGCFNPFNIFPKRSNTNSVALSPSKENAKPVFIEKDTCFSMLWSIRRKEDDPIPEISSQTAPVTVNYEPTTSDPLQTPKYIKESASIEKGHSIVASGASQVPSSKYPSTDLRFPTIHTVNSESIINVPLPETTTEVNPQPTGRSWLGYDGVLAEILKSIVYGGLMEVIASLSVVTSAAASDAATVSIVALALASMIGGISVIGNNIWDLRNDCYKDNSSEDNKHEATNKYKELLGQVDYFPLHVVFVLLSFVVFGMIPPVAYGYAFHETNDKDFTIVVVAATSLLCITLLTLFKAYINKCTIFEYFKTVVYYVTVAVSASGVSYVAGNLVMRLMEELGWFDMNSGGAMSLLPHTIRPSLASY